MRASTTFLFWQPVRSAVFCFKKGTCRQWSPRPVFFLRPLLARICKARIFGRGTLVVRGLWSYIRICLERGKAFKTSPFVKGTWPLLEQQHACCAFGILKALRLIGKPQDLLYFCWSLEVKGRDPLDFWRVEVSNVWMLDEQKPFLSSSSSCIFTEIYTNTEHLGLEPKGPMFQKKMTHQIEGRLITMVETASLNHVDEVATSSISVLLLLWRSHANSSG